MRTSESETKLATVAIATLTISFSDDNGDGGGDGEKASIVQKWRNKLRFKPKRTKLSSTKLNQKSFMCMCVCVILVSYLYVLHTLFCALNCSMFVDVLVST